MSFLRNEPTLRQEDYPKETASSMSRLFNSLTPFFSAITTLINGEIDYVYNIAAVTRSYSLTNVIVPFSIQWPFVGRPPMDLRITKALAGSTPTILIPAWSFDVSTNTIAVTKILEAPGMSVPVVGVLYQFTVRATI